REAELAASDAKFKAIVEDNKLQIEQANITDAQRTKLLAEAEKVRVNVIQAAAQARIDINKKYDDQELKLREAADKALSELANNQQAEEISRINQRYIERTEAIRKGGKLTADVEKQIEQNRQRDIDDVNIKYGKKTIEELTKLREDSIKVDEKYAKESARTEQAKQLAILEAQLSGAEQYVQLLLANNKTENDQEVKNAQTIVKNLKQAIKNNLDATPKFSLFESIFGNLSNEDQDLVKGALNSTLNSLRSITASINEQYQKQIDKKQELIDSYDDDINTLEDALDRERDLMDRGLANNVANVEKELEAKKAARDEEVRQQEELQKRQEAIRKADAVSQQAAMLATNIQTGVDMVSAIAKVFKAHAGIPFVGVALAVGFTALLASTFFSLKNMFTANKKMAEGGWIEGPSHKQGGVKYRAMDGSNRIVELEGDEFVTKKKQAAKYGDLLEAINEDRFPTMGDEALHKMFADMGISFDSERHNQVLHVVHQKETLQHEIALKMPNGSNDDIKAIKETVKQMQEDKRNEVREWESGGYGYRKKGNTTVRWKL
ncbi:MAG TPA: hypothetical protein VD794_12800, partial [Flavisolibacter sp.]|nr:hypothetical protein [Flavisolibacter sp.]